jgi:hypothetical protein
MLRPPFGGQVKATYDFKVFSFALAHSCTENAGIWSILDFPSQLNVKRATERGRFFLASRRHKI